jgi:uncharacterized coiled-coil DUF342 family protein
LATATIAKNWNSAVKWVSEQPDILQKYLASEYSKNISPNDRAALEQILSQLSQVMQVNSLQGRSNSLQDRIDQINAELAKLDNGASNNTPEIQAKIAKLKRELQNLTKTPARAMSQTGSAKFVADEPR